MAEAAVELRAILDSAERAASAQDFASAEHYLRQAAVIQEAQLGPLHPELANTLNNLGIVFERVGKPADAEASYRRAYAIATATLAADDPLVMTSGQNLRDFCAATGKPFELAPPPPAAISPAPGVVPMSATPRATPVATSQAPEAVRISAAPRATPVAATSAPPTVPVAPPSSPVPQPVAPDTPAAVTAVRSSVRAESAAATSRRYLTALAITSLIAIVATIAWLAAPTSSNVTPAAPPAAAAAPPAPPAEVAPSRQANADTAREHAAAPRADTTPAVAETPPVAGAAKARPASRAAVSLVETKLCRSLSLSDWQCTPLTSPAAPGRVFFYTRVRAGSDTAVQHRWHINGSLLQNVELRVGANTGAGFRTYSRNTVAAGTWTIELRDADGALLHEERFVVQ